MPVRRNRNPCPGPGRRAAVAMVAAGAAAVACVGLAGCNPTYNWRDARLEDAGLTGLLPCKPDQAQRPVSLPETGEVVLSMIGCATGGATFTLAHIHLPDAARAGAAIDQWRAATLMRLGGHETARTPLALAGSLELPQAGLSSIAAPAPAGASAALESRSAWFARIGAPDLGGVELFQAAILGSRIDGAVAETFFSNLRLRQP